MFPFVSTHALLPTPLPLVYTLSVVMAMVAHRRRRKADAMAAAGVAVRAIRDLADTCPPLKSVAAVVVVVWDTSKVRTFLKWPIEIVAWRTRKTRSNKKDCKRLVSRAAEMVHDIWRQTKDYGDR
jgi:hypothetical protein